MRLALTILYGVTTLALASGAAASMQYEVDDDRDGRTDRLLILEQSDSLA